MCLVGLYEASWKMTLTAPLGKVVPMARVSVVPSGRLMTMLPPLVRQIRKRGAESNGPGGTMPRPKVDAQKFIVSVWVPLGPHLLANVEPRNHVKSNDPAGGIRSIPPNGKPDTAA